jgi:hypothetical protein
MTPQHQLYPVPLSRNAPDSVKLKGVFVIGSPPSSPTSDTISDALIRLGGCFTSRACSGLRDARLHAQLGFRPSSQFTPLRYYF